MTRPPARRSSLAGASPITTPAPEVDEAAPPASTSTSSTSSTSSTRRTTTPKTRAKVSFYQEPEDTDRVRSTEAAVKTLLEAMQWLGLDFDEAPVYQSQTAPLHLAAAEELVKKGHAYREDKGGTGQGEAILFRMPGTDMSSV